MADRNQSYDHLAGNPLDVKDHPDTVLPDISGGPSIAGEYAFRNEMNRRKAQSELSDQVNFYNTIGNMYKGQNN